MTREAFVGLPQVHKRSETASRQVSGRRYERCHQPQTAVILRGGRSEIGFGITRLLHFGLLPRIRWHRPKKPRPMNAASTRVLPLPVTVGD